MPDSLIPFRTVRPLIDVTLHQREPFLFPEKDGLGKFFFGLIDTIVPSIPLWIGIFPDDNAKLVSVIPPPALDGPDPMAALPECRLKPTVLLPNVSVQRER